MDDQKELNSVFQEISSQWAKAGTDLWTPMAKAWADTVSAAFVFPTGGKETDKKSRWQSSFESSVGTLLALSTAMGQNAPSDMLIKGLFNFPQAWMKMAHTGMEAFSSLQKLWMEKTGRIHASTQAYQFENLDENVFRIWSEVYEKEVKPFIRIPQLGPARFYQERLSETIDAFNRFQTAVGEFMRLLYLPVEKSLKVLEEDLKRKAEIGELPKTSREFYQAFIKVLEGHYMTLFKSDEYVEVMAKTLRALEDYMEKRNRLTTDWAKLFSMPTQEDLDTLYKEIYLLKKRLRTLEKRS